MIIVIEDNQVTKGAGAQLQVKDKQKTGADNRGRNPCKGGYAIVRCISMYILFYLNFLSFSINKY